VLTAKYLDHLAQRRLSRQQAEILIELFEVEPGEWKEWRPAARSRSESAVISRRVHRLAQRHYVQLGGEFGRERFSDLVLTPLGRDMARELFELASK
jgi:hypothetical protein